MTTEQNILKEIALIFVKAKNNITIREEDMENAKIVLQLAQKENQEQIIYLTTKKEEAEHYLKQEQELRCKMAKEIKKLTDLLIKEKEETAEKVEKLKEEIDAHGFDTKEQYDLGFRYACKIIKNKLHKILKDNTKKEAEK